MTKTLEKPSEPKADGLHEAVAELLHNLSEPSIQELPLINWGSPIPCFGDPTRARVATLGLNPSNLEFVDRAGSELSGRSRRFHSLGSLGLDSWSQATDLQCGLILAQCKDYFTQNPYDTWFRVLDRVLRLTPFSYYSKSEENPTACHLDLVPYATKCKWSSLVPKERKALLKNGGQTLAKIIRASSVEVLILNGKTVVDNLELLADSALKSTCMSDWKLPRKNGKGVSGYAYTGQIDRIAGIPLGRSILILGYNHNLQSSFGVTKQVSHAISEWLRSQMERLFS